MSMFFGWGGVKLEFIRDGVKGLRAMPGCFEGWRIPLKVRATLDVEGIWNGAILRVRMAHSPNSEEWFSTDGGEFMPISADGKQIIEFTQPTLFDRIEYWVENPDKFTLIRFYVEIEHLENPIYDPFQDSPISDDALIESSAVLELYAFGEGIRVEDIDHRSWRGHPLKKVVGKIKGKRLHGL